MWLLRNMKKKVPITMNDDTITNWYRLSRNLRGRKSKIEREEIEKELNELEQKYANTTKELLNNQYKQTKMELLQKISKHNNQIIEKNRNKTTNSPPPPTSPSPQSPAIKFDNVSESYANDMILNNLNNTITAKSFVDVKYFNIKQNNPLCDDKRSTETFDLSLKSVYEGSDIDTPTLQVAKDYVPTFNLAAYVNNSLLLQKFIELGVDLNAIERRKGLAEFVLKLDFEKDVQSHLLFLKDQGVPAEKFGEIITKNPLFFKTTIDDLQVRIDYMISKRFKQSQRERIILLNPFWLNFSTQRIDRRLGYFQQEFKLTGDNVRFIATKSPRLITYNIEHIRKATFCIREEMGFNKDEIMKLLINKPRLWMMKSDDLIERFSYANKEMKLSHSTILKFPEVLLSREFRLRQRHEYLEMLGRAQYNPTQDMFISPKELVEGNDKMFANNVAKTDFKTYELFLKTK